MEIRELFVKYEIVKQECVSCIKNIKNMKK